MRASTRPPGFPWRHGVALLWLASLVGVGAVVAVAGAAPHRAGSVTSASAAAPPSASGTASSAASAAPAPSASGTALSAASAAPAPAPSAPAVAAPPLAPPSASGAPRAAPAEAAPVELFGRRLYAFQVPRDGRSPRQRATEASQALARAAPGARGAEVTSERRGDAAMVLVGGAPVIHLGPEDAVAAGAPSVDALAADVAAEVRAALDAERRRAATIRTVFSLALVLVSGLCALFLARFARGLAGRARRWLDVHADRVPALSLRSIEVVNARVVRGSLDLGLSVVRWVVELGIAYAWLVFALSRFDRTRGYTSRMAGLVLSPLSALFDRLATVVPPAIVGLFLAAALLVLLRFLTLYFAAVGRGETELAWVRPELARPTSVLIQIGVVVAALVFLGPVVTGDPSNPLTLLGSVAVAAFGLASAPLVAGALLGAIHLYTGRLPTGRVVAVAGRVGRVVSVDLFEVRLVDRIGRELRIPHLAAAWRPIRVLGDRARVAVRVTLGAATTPSVALGELRDAAASVGEEPRAEIVGLDAAGPRVRVSVASDRPDARSALYLALLPVLDRAGAPPPPRPRPLVPPR